MTVTEVREALLELSAEERLRLADEVYSALTPEVELRLTPELEEVLQTRLEEARSNPDAGIAVEEAHAEIRNGLE